MGRTPRRSAEPEPVTAREFITFWQNSNSVAEVAKKVHCRKAAARLRAMRYRRLGIPLKYFPVVELPDWDELAAYAESLLPKGADATGVGRRDEDEEDLADPSDIEEAEPGPAAIMGEEDSSTPVGVAKAEPAARNDVPPGDAPSDGEQPTEKTALGETE